MKMRVSAVAAYCRPCPSKPSTAFGVTQIRLRGILLSTRVQAEKQVPEDHSLTRLPQHRKQLDI
jgi:hypothetical protein